MQSLIRSKSAGVTGGRGTAGAGPGRDLLYHRRRGEPTYSIGPRVTPRTTQHAPLPPSSSLADRTGAPQGLAVTVVRRPHTLRHDATQYRCCYADATREPPRHAPTQPQGQGQRFDYVHARRHGSSGLFTGPGDAPTLPLSC